MCEVGQAGNWRVRKLEVSMLDVLTKGILICQAFVNVKFNGVLKSAGTVNIREFDAFRDVNQDRVDTLLVTAAH